LARRTRLGASLLVIVVAIVTSAGAARADGDPASDVLYTERLFVPFDTGISKGAQETLAAALAEAERAGYPIRVALIEKVSDLGAVTVLWGKPKQYARFLDLELSFGYKGPLLIVMPSGIGFAHYNGGTAAEYRTLAAVPVQPGADGLALSATNAVERLALRAGHPIATPTQPTPTDSSNLSSRLLAGGIVLGVLALTLGAFAVIRRRPART
jgi:hypothetical protein